MLSSHILLAGIFFVSSLLNQRSIFSLSIDNQTGKPLFTIRFCSKKPNTILRLLFITRCTINITALGHSCILLSFACEEQLDPIQILVDPWLSDHATGDVMSRFPRLRFDIDVLGNIDAVYLTHAHCDHLDPYTLIRLWKELKSPPTLIIPISLRYLVPIFQQYLSSPKMIVLEPHKPIDFHGIELLGFFDVGQHSHNEEDVMILILTHQRERVLIEADARLALDLVNFRQYISMLMRDPQLESVVYLSTENELTGTMESRNCLSFNDRQALFEYAFEELYESIYQLYQPVEDPADLWYEKKLLRLIHGQGLTAPHELDSRWQKILFPVRIADRVQAEREIAHHYGFQHRIDGLRVGYVHTIISGKIKECIPVAGLTLLDTEESRLFDHALSFFPQFPCAPLRSNTRDIPNQKNRIIELLNQFFLPYLHASRNPPMIHLLSENQGTYRIRIHYGQQIYKQAFDYILSFDNYQFVQTPPIEEAAHEIYWANDLEDFLDGHCDEFSTFCRKQFSAPYMHLWSFLATPLLNSALLIKRIQIHFERASKGKTPGSWVLAMYKEESPS